MKKIIMLIIVVLISSFCVSAYTRDIIQTFSKPGEASCYVNAQAMIPVTQFKDVYPLEQITFITAVHNETGEQILLYGKWYELSGTLLYKQYKETKTVKSGKNAYYITDEYLLPFPGDYVIYLTTIPFEVLDWFDDSNSLQYHVKCPGYHYSCKFVNLKIDKCYSDLDYFYTYFYGTGEKDYSKVDVLEDINISLNYRAFADMVGYTTPLPSSFTIEKIDEDYYLLKIPRNDLKDDIKTIRMHIFGCIEGFYNVSFVKTCYFVNETSIKEQTIVEDKPQIEEKQKEIIIKRYQKTNETQEQEDIDFVEKIIAFFKRIFRFLR